MMVLAGSALSELGRMLFSSEKAAHAQSFDFVLATFCSAGQIPLHIQLA